MNNDDSIKLYRLHNADDALRYAALSQPDVISAKADDTSYTIGKSSNDYGRPIVKATADSAWVDLEFVNKYSDFTYEFYESPSRLVIINEWKEITYKQNKSLFH